MQEPMSYVSPVILDDYNADLNFNIRADGLAGHSLSYNGWQYMWAGCRATHGVLSGRVFFEVHVINQYNLNEYLEVSDVRADCNVRVGWSHDHTNLLVGEENASYGYDGSGLKCLDQRFDVYGETIRLHDVITCYLDLDSSMISFQKNDKFLGTAYKLDKRIKDQPFFPHVCTKNTEVFINFGQQPPAFKVLPGFVFMCHAFPGTLVFTPRGPSKPTSCELLMLIGLPGAGKTTYAEKYKKEHPEKRFYIIGQDMIMGHLRNPSVRRNKLKWNKVVKLASDIFREQLKLAGTKLWNYIIDQTNVYAGARRHKLSIFDGYRATAAVLVVTDQELIKRCKEREGVMPKHIPLPVVDEMKKNFTLPHEDEGLFVEIRYMEQSRQISESIVTNYKTSRESNNKPGILKMPGSTNGPPYPSNMPFFRPPPQHYKPHSRHPDKEDSDYYETSYSDNTYDYEEPHKEELQIQNLAKSVDNIRMKEPNSADIIKSVKSYPSYTNRKNVHESQKGSGLPQKGSVLPQKAVYPVKSYNEASADDEIPPLVPIEKKEKKEEKPEQIVHPIQINPVHPIVQQPHLVSPMKQQMQPVYMPGLPGLDSHRDKGLLGSRPGIIPMSKINDHTVFSNHIPPPANSLNSMYSAAAQQNSALQSQLMNHHRASLGHLPFGRSQTPVSSVSYPSPIGTPSYNQTNNNFNNSQQFLSQQTDHLLYSALTFPQSGVHPFQQMVMPQNHQIGQLDFSGVMALQQSNIQDQFNNMAGYRTYNIHKPKPFGR